MTMTLRQPLSYVCLALCACVGPPDRTELLHSVVWVQTAAERDAVCTQAWKAATDAMRALTSDQSARPKPFAVIVDVDETMLDNSPYQAMLVRDQQRFAEDSWQRWCELAQAAAIPGALPFATDCHQRGVTVFYVTNRAESVEESTRRNLQTCGFPLDDRPGVDVVLSRAKGQPASKQARRDEVARTHEVVLVVGDDLNDFVDAEPSVVQRRLQVRRHEGDWGSRWFVVPNPMYGSWERAVTAGGADATAAKFSALVPMR